MILSVLNSTMDQYKFGTVKLKKAISKPSGMHFGLAIKSGFSRVSTGSCLKVMLVLFRVPKPAVMSWSFTAGGHYDSSGRNS